jgi:hypothetical protein
MLGWQITLIAAAAAAMLSATAGSAHHHPSQAFRRAMSKGGQMRIQSPDGPCLW